MQSVYSTAQANWVWERERGGKERIRYNKGERDPCEATAAKYNSDKCITSVGKICQRNNMSTKKSSESKQKFSFTFIDPRQRREPRCSRSAKKSVPEDLLTFLTANEKALDVTFDIHILKPLRASIAFALATDLNKIFWFATNCKHISQPQAF